MKKSTLHEIAGVLVTAGHSNLAEVITGGSGGSFGNFTDEEVVIIKKLKGAYNRPLRYEGKHYKGFIDFSGVGNVPSPGFSIGIIKLKSGAIKVELWQYDKRIKSIKVGNVKEIAGAIKKLNK